MFRLMVASNLMVVTLMGCVSVGKDLSQQYDIMITRLETLRFSAKPSHQQLNQQFKQAAKHQEADPYSIRDFSIQGKPEKCAYMSASNILYPRDTFDLPSWCSVVQYNSKNKYGAYEGLKRQVLVSQKEKPLLISPSEYNRETRLSGWAAYDETLYNYKKARKKRATSQLNGTLPDKTAKHTD